MGVGIRGQSGGLGRLFLREGRRPVRAPGSWAGSRRPAAAPGRVSELARKLAKWPVPRPPRLLADDVTAEAVASLLADYGRMVVMSTEAGIFEAMAGRYFRGVPNLGVYLKSYSGDTLHVDRRTRPSEHVERPSPDGGADGPAGRLQGCSLRGATQL